jgi:hypothetical protein
MRLIKEPLDIDFIVDSRPLTQEEEKRIDDFIRADKEKREINEKKFFDTFGAFPSEKSPEELAAEIRESRKFREKDLKL